MSISNLVNGINATWYNGPVLLPFYDGSSGLRPGQIAYDQIGVVVPGEPGMVYWDGSAWVQFLGTSTIPNLQQVTDVGATTANSITIEASADEVSREFLVSTNLGAAAIHIQSGRSSGIDIASIIMQGGKAEIASPVGVELEFINGSAQVMMTIFADGSGFRDRNGVVHRSGTGNPEGIYIGSVGSTFSRIDGAPGETFYIKQTGTGLTGWVPLA